MSKEWWYSEHGDRKGPLSFEEVCGLVADGTLTPRTLVWKKGLEAWAPLSESPEFDDAIRAIPPEIPQPTPREENIELPLAGPWRRFFARLIDLWAIALPVSFIVAYLAGSLSLEFALWIQEPGSEYAFGWLLLPAVLLVEGVIYALFGTTLGKAILGIKVVTVSAHKASAGQYLKRLLGVYWGGLATGFPLVNLFTMAHQYGRLRRGKHAGYDEGKFNIKGTKLGFFRVMFAVLAMAGLFTVQVGLRVMNQGAEHSYYSGTDWTNDVTGLTVSIPAGWVHERQQNEDEQPIDIFSGPRVGGFAVFGKEDVDPTLSLAEYARIWGVATEGTMELSVPGRPISVLGRAGLHITGYMTDDRAQKIDAVIVKNGRHVWRVVLLGTSGRNPASEEALQLRNVLFSSIP
jgi:uncharacterized RDD family membrane protein YckC